MKRYKIDTHIHTSETSSCGKVNADKVVRLYAENKYDALLITDHYYCDYFSSLKTADWDSKIDIYLKGYRTAKKTGEELGLNIMLGIELRFDFSPNDFLVYGMNEDFLYRYPELYKMTPSEFYAFKKDKGLAIFQAHPFRQNMTIEKNENIDGIEVINGNPRHDSNNILAYNYAKKNNLRMLSGSDFHQIPDIARGGLIVNEMPEDSEDFAEFILSRRKKILIGESELCA